jgi:hypothetical protein
MTHPLRTEVGNPRGRLEDQVSLLPTPSASNVNDGESIESWSARREREKAKSRNGNGFGLPLAMAVQLLSTPTANDSRNGRNATANRSDTASGHHSGTTLSDVVYEGALLPTPQAHDSETTPKTPEQVAANLILPSAVMPLLPTPRVAATRTSRSAATRQDSLSGPSLEQAVEIARGELPREFTSWDELSASWHGDRTSPPSDAGS